MALLLAAIAGGVGVSLATWNEEPRPTAWTHPHGIPRVENTTGRYGDLAAISEIVDNKGEIVGQKLDVDLSGVPCRWLYLRNGSAYRTYNLQTP